MPRRSAWKLPWFPPGGINLYYSQKELPVGPRDPNVSYAWEGGKITPFPLFRSCKNQTKLEDLKKRNSQNWLSRLEKKLCLNCVLIRQWILEPFLPSSVCSLDGDCICKERKRWRNWEQCQNPWESWAIENLAYLWGQACQEVKCRLARNDLCILCLPSETTCPDFQG